MEELENFSKEELVIDLVKANKFGLLLFIPTTLLFGLPFFLIWMAHLDFYTINKSFSSKAIATDGMLVFVYIILGIILHELIHGVTWALFAKKGFKSIKFGVFWKMLTPYCHCKVPLKVKHYIFGAITPAIFLGIIPAIIAIVNGNIWMLLFGMFFTMAAGGDFMIINLVRKENMNDFVQDHPSAAGCYIYRKRKVLMN